MFHWGSTPPDFYPPLKQFCSLDQQVADVQVADLINRIQGNPAANTPQVAETMALAFIDLYERVIWAIQHPDTINPPLPPGQLAGLQGQISDLQHKIDQLEEFLMTLMAIMALDWVTSDDAWHGNAEHFQEFREPLLRNHAHLAV